MANDPLTDAFDKSGVMSRLENDDELFKELLVIFFEEFPKLLGKIDGGIAGNDAAEVTLHAHSLKGALSNVGAVAAAKAALALEHAGKSLQLDGAQALRAELTREVERFRRALEVAGY